MHKLFLYLFRRLPRQIRVLPVLVMVASLAFLVRVGEAVTDFRSLAGSAVAAEPEAAREAEKAKAEPKAEPKGEGEKQILSSQKKPDQEKPDGPEKPGERPTEKPTEKTAGEGAESDPRKWTDASESDAEYSGVRQEMHEDLLARRQQLDSREKALGEREALLEAGKKELDRKFQELSGLRDEIKGLLKAQSQEEEARIASLVKIYEGMKPKDAARIFNTLDTDILLRVVSRMGERKSAAILSVMDAERAKILTTLLAEQKSLPDSSSTLPSP